MRTTRTGAITAALAVLLAGLALVGARPAPVGAAETLLTMANVRSTAVDPGTGRIFVSGDDEVEVFVGDGTHLTTIGDLEGASGLAVEGDHLFVAETGAGTISRVDAASALVVDTWATGLALVGTLVVVDGIVWFGADVEWHGPQLHSLDPATGQVTPRGGSFASSFSDLVEVPGRPDRILASTGGSPPTLYELDISGPTVVADPSAGVRLFGSITEMAVNSDGDRLVAADVSSVFTELGRPGWVRTGVRYTSGVRPNGIAYSDARGGVYAGSTRSGRSVAVFAEGVPSPLASFTTIGRPLDATVEIAADASRVYVVTIAPGVVRLEHFPVQPTISGVAPASVIAGTPAALRVQGSALGAVTHVEVAGTSATVMQLSTDELEVTLPRDLAPGVHDLVITTPLGEVTSPIEILAGQPASVQGEVLGATGTLGGAELTLDGGPLERPLVASADSNGAYGFTDLEWGDDYSLAVSDPTGEHPARTFEDITLTPGVTTHLDLDLAGGASPRASALRGANPLPAPARRLVAHEGSGRSFASAGDEVLVLAGSGRIVDRIPGQWTANGLALVGDDLYVNRREAASVAQIDVHSLRVERVLSTGGPTDGQLVHAGGRLWFGDGGDRLLGLDTTDGTVAAATGVPHLYPPQLAPVAGAPDRMLVRSDSTRLVEVEGAALTTLASSSTVSGGPHVTASAVADRAWTSTGGEFELQSLQPTGLSYPSVCCSVAHTPARGGLLAFGRSVSLPGAPEVVAELGFDPTNAVVFSGDGTKVLAGRLDPPTITVWDLAPHVASIEPPAVVDEVPASITLDGDNLEATAAVAVDGHPVTFTRSAGGTITFDLPEAVEAGVATVLVTTPLGETTTPLVVEANTGATLTGVVRSTDGPLAGIVLEVPSASSGAPPPTATTGPDGRYTLAGIPYGIDHRLEVHDPTGAHADQIVAGIELTPNGSATLDVELSADRSDLRWAQDWMDVPPRQVLVNPDDGRIFVSTDGDLRTYDHHSHLRARKLLSGRLAGLALVDGDLYVNEVDEQRITRLDPETLSTTGSWTTGTATNGQLASAGGRLWFTAGGSFGVTTLASLDPVTGAIVRYDEMPVDRPMIRPVAGNQDLLLLWATRGRGGSGRLLDVSGASPVTLAVSSGRKVDAAADVVASAAAGKAWTNDGVEWDLATLTPTGITYPGAYGGVAHSPAHGGLLAVDGAVYRLGSTTAIGDYLGEPDPGMAAFTHDGSRLVSGESWGTGGRVLTHDLRPHVSTSHPRAIRPGSADVAVGLTGSGLGGVSSASIDGQPVTITAQSVRSITILVPEAMVEDPTALEVSLSSVTGTSDPFTLPVAFVPPEAPLVYDAWWEEGQVHVVWEEPGDPGTSPVTHYEVSLDGVTWTFPPPSDEAWVHVTLDHVPPPGEHTVEVRAVSADGTGPPGSVHWLQIPAIAPTSPVGVTASPGPGSLAVAWSPPEQPGNTAIDAYEVFLDGQVTRVSASRLDLVIHPLDPGVPVTVGVRALSDAGPSGWEWTAATTPGPAGPLFADVAWGHRFYREIRGAVEAGLTGGYPDGTFRPTAPVSRQAAAAFLWRLAGEPTGPFPDPGFTDVPANHTFRDAIWWAADQGITTGYEDDTFRPTAPVTRQAWMTFQWRAEGEPEPTCDDATFPDVPPTHRFHEPITWAACEGITGGYDDGTFRPTAIVSRQAAVAFLVRPLLPTWQPLPNP